MIKTAEDWINLSELERAEIMVEMIKKFDIINNMLIENLDTVLKIRESRIKRPLPGIQGDV